MVLISIASVEDPSLAPPGKHTLHAYLPATEPFHLWEGEAAATQTPAASLQGISLCMHCCTLLPNTVRWSWCGYACVRGLKQVSIQYLQAGLERGSPEYEQLKEERGEVLWKAVERIIPDIRKRAEISMVGSTLPAHQLLPA